MQAAALASLVVGGSCQAADLFVLEAGERVLCSNAPIEVLDNAVPETADWNNDGKIDLLVSGMEKNGDDPALYLFLNASATSDGPPVFNHASLVGMFPKRWG